MAKTKDVRAAVEKELGFDPLVNSADIKVVNIGGNVNLTGTVPSFPQYLEASAAARRVAGVTTRWTTTWRWCCRKATTVTT